MALLLTPGREREILESLATSEALTNVCVDLATFLEILEQTNPSQALLTGGVLFEAYVIRNGSKKHSNMLIHALEKHTNLNEQVEAIFKANAMPFWFHMVTSCRDVDRTCNINLFYWTLLQDYHGLSRFGRFVASVARVGMDPRTYDRHLNAALQKHDQNVASLLQENKALIVFDNYSHSFGNPRFKSDRSTQIANANYTVMGLSECAQPMCRYVVDEKGLPLFYPYKDKKRTFHSCRRHRPFTSSPKGRFGGFFTFPVEQAPKNVSRLQQVFYSYKNQNMRSLSDVSQWSAPYNYWELSEVVKHNVVTVPLASPSRIQSEREEEHALLYHERGLQNFRPWKVHQSNSASNKGLMNIIADVHLAALHATARGEYAFVRVDVSIFRSWCMVCPSSSHASTVFRAVGHLRQS
jgi:hypothetical protein